MLSNQQKQETQAIDIPWRKKASFAYGLKMGSRGEVALKEASAAASKAVSASK